jgi:hypothetical protein
MSSSFVTKPATLVTITPVKRDLGLVARYQGAAAAPSNMVCGFLLL